MPTDYFLPEEFEQIVAATEKYEYGGAMTMSIVVNAFAPYRC